MNKSIVLLINSISTIVFLALACAISHQCESCIETHVHACKHAGATVEEIEELTAVTSLMGGGPGLAFSNKALAKVYEIYL